jgi:hypothetical protein
MKEFMEEFCMYFVFLPICDWDIFPRKFLEKIDNGDISCAYIKHHAMETCGGIAPRILKLDTRWR